MLDSTYNRTLTGKHLIVQSFELINKPQWLLGGGDGSWLAIDITVCRPTLRRATSAQVYESDRRRLIAKLR